MDIRTDQDAVEAVEGWDLNSVNAVVKLCEQRTQNSKASAAASSVDTDEQGELTKETELPILFKKECLVCFSAKVKLF